MDSTVYWGKSATDEFEMYVMGYPYISAGDALNLYFRSANIPTPNRMNWSDPETDELLVTGSQATNETDRAAAYAKVMQKVHDSAVWLPIYHRPMQIGYSTKLAPFVAHNIYGAGLYKGLQLAFTE